MDGSSWHCIGERDKDHPHGKEMKKAKWLSEEALQIAVKRREMKSKGEKERYKHLNAEFWRRARRDKTAFLSNQCKEIEANNRMGKTRDLFKKIRDTKGTFHAKMDSIKDKNCMDLIPPSIRVFSNESTFHMRWPKYWSFSFNISPYNEYSGLISFRIYWVDLLAVQGTLKNLLQHYSSKASILRHSAFFRVQLSHPYVTTGKTIALTI